MDIKTLRERILYIVDKCVSLKDQYTDEKDALVNYVCIFSHTNEEYDQLSNLASQLGPVIKVTPMGPIYHITPIETQAGELKLLKIRKPSEQHSDSGDTDFTVEDYHAAKQKYIGKARFTLIKRPDIEMIELMDPAYDVRVYFSNPTLDQTLELR